MLNPEEGSIFSTKQPRSVRAFASPQEAVDFLATCLEEETLIQLLAEIHAVSQQVGRSKAVIDRFKDVFAQMQATHRNEDLRTHYSSAQFPRSEEHYALGGVLARQCDVLVQFAHLDQGWVLERLDYL
ncbi:hypothetical protein GC175_26985 [bacterium]|nr:hypothetical protein [bacterium]